MIVVLIICADPAAGRRLPGPMQRAAGRRLLTRSRDREPLTRPDAQGNGPRLLGAGRGNRSPGPMQSAAGPMPRERRGLALLTLPDGMGTVYPARCPGNGPRLLARAAGNRSPCPMQRAAGPMPWGTAAGRRLLTLPDGMGTAHPARCPGDRPRLLARCPGEPFTRPDATGRGPALCLRPDAQGNRPRGTAHPARCNPAAGPMPRERAALAWRGPRGTAHPARWNGHSCSPSPMPRGTGRDCLRGPRGTVYPARCNGPRVRCPGDRPRAGECSPGPMQPAAGPMPRERAALTGAGRGNRLPCPMQWAAGPMPRGTGRACLARAAGNRSPGPMQPAAGRGSAHPGDYGPKTNGQGSISLAPNHPTVC